MAYEFFMNLADKKLKIDALYAETQQWCRNYIFAEELAEEDADIRITMTPEILEQEAQRLRDSWHLTELPPRFTPQYLEVQALLRLISNSFVEHDTFLMHGSALTLDGKAYLFTAPSATGKSTMSRNWIRDFGDRVVMINDDKPLIRICNGQVYACGNPWNGKHKLGENIVAPLAGICFLTRNDTNHIRRLSVSEAFTFLFQQIHRPDDEAIMLKTLDLLDKLLELVPVYEMKVNNFLEDAVPTAYRGMVKPDDNVNNNEVKE